MAKLTNEEFIKKLAEINPNIESLEEYKGVDYKILFRCKKCGHEWMGVPYNYTRTVTPPCRCPKCVKMEHRITNDEFIRRLSKVNPTITALEKYETSNSKLRFRCNMCGHIWSTRAGDLTKILPNGKTHGCPKCEMDSRGYSNEEFINKLKNINPDIEALEEYKGIFSKITFKCNICNHIWQTAPNVLIGKHNGKHSGCPKCAIKKQMFTEEHFIEKLYKVNPNLKLLSKYEGVNHKVDLECTICGHKFSTTANGVFYINKDSGRPTGCPECGKRIVSNKLKMSHEDFIIRMSSQHPELEVLGEYKTNKCNIKVRCKKCGQIWYPNPSNLLSNNSGCPTCRKSRGERIIELYFQEHNIEYIPQKRFEACKNVIPLPFDFYLPKHKICVEYDGEGHFEPVKFGGCSDVTAEKIFQQTIRHDKMKNDFCKENNISLLRIPYWDFDNIPNILNEELHIKEAVLSPAQ